METQYQQSGKNMTIDSSVSASTITRKAQTVIGTSSSTQSAASVINSGLSGSSVNTAGTSSNITTNFLPNSNSINSQINSSGQPTSQQIIQISSQGGLMSGQQLMVQTLPGRQAIQLRAQGGQQIQFIPFGSIQGQNQRQPVIIQQQAPGSVLHSASATTITSMANLPHNVAKITSVGTNSLQNSGSHQKPVIIQQTSGSFLHSSGTSHHNVAKLTTVNRNQARPSQAKMINISTSGLGHLTNSTTSGSTNHTGQNQIHHLATTTGSNSQQVTRLNIISSLPSGAHSSVSNVQQHGAKPIISLAATTLNKSLILNPAPNVVQPSIVGNVSGSSMHSVVNVANMGTFNTTQHQLKHSNVATNIIPTVMTLTTLTTSGCSIPTRHNMITSTTSGNFFQSQQSSQRLTVSSSNISTNHTGTIQQINSSNSTQNSLQSSSSNLQHTQKVNQSQNSSTSHPLYSTVTSTMRSNLAPSSSSLMNSPIKQQISQQTPSSPRPSILIRKRVGTLIDENKNQSNNNNASNNSNINNAINNLNNSFLSKQHSIINSLKPSSTIQNSNLNTRNNELINKTVNSVRKSDSQSFLKNENQNEPTSKTVENNLESSISSNNLVLNNNYLTTDNRITPRKRRKQLLEPFTLTTSQNIKSLSANDDNKSNNLCNEDYLKKQDSNGPNINQVNNLNNSICRRPRPSLLSTYNVPGKSLQCHFLRHCEVKLKPEKKTNLNEITSESLLKKNEWKVHHLSTQLQDILENEITFNQKLKKYLNIYDTNKDRLPSKVLEIGNKPFNAKIKHNSITILDKLSDLISANIQRSNLFQEQIKETNSIMIKLTNEHKEKVNKLTKRLINKRNYSNFRDKKTVG